MQQLMLSMLLCLCLIIHANGQQYSGQHDVDIPLLDAGTSTWPIKLSKRWFEGDTIYLITFRDASRNTTGETGSQGFFKFELKNFGRALNTALAIDSRQEVRFSNGTITVTKRVFGKRLIECTFASRTGTFRGRAGDVQKLIDVISKQ